MQDEFWTTLMLSQNDALPRFTYHPLGFPSLNNSETEKDLISRAMKVQKKKWPDSPCISPEKLRSTCPRACTEQHLASSSHPPSGESSSEAARPRGRPPPAHSQPLDTQDTITTHTSSLEDSTTEDRRITRKRKGSLLRSQQSATVRGLSPLTPLTTSDTPPSEGIMLSLSSQDEDPEVEEPLRKKKRSLRPRKSVNYAEDAEQLEKPEKVVDLAELFRDTPPVPPNFILRKLPAAALAYKILLDHGLSPDSLIYQKDNKVCKVAVCGITMSEKSEESSFARHIRTHFPEESGYMWKCPHCRKLYDRPDNASRHLPGCMKGKASQKKLKVKAKEFRRNVYLFLPGGKGYDFSKKDLITETTYKKHARNLD